MRKFNESSKKVFMTKSDILNAFLKSEITIQELIEYADGLENVATKKELEDFLKNNFLIGVMAETHDIKPEAIKSKIQELIKMY